MADPVTAMAFIGMGASIAGGATSAFGSIMGGNSQNAMYQYKAGMAQMNSRLDAQNAVWALDSGDTNAMEKGLAAGQQIGQTRVNIAASGNDVNTGTSARVNDSQHSAAAFDQDVIRFDAAKTAYGYEVKSNADVAEAGLDIAAGSNAQTAGDIAAAGTILSTAGSVASKWQQASMEGVPAFSTADAQQQADPWAGLRTVTS